jgi:hypothetical protein
MKKLSDYKDYEGVDGSLEVSLYEYGLIWKTIDNEEYKFIYGVDIDDKGFYNKFDYAYLSKKDFVDIFNDWGNKSDIESFTGEKFDTWIESFPHCVFDMLGYYGCYNVFGSSYYNPFEIINDSKNKE